MSSCCTRNNSFWFAIVGMHLLKNHILHFIVSILALLRERRKYKHETAKGSRKNIVQNCIVSSIYLCKVFTHTQNYPNPLSQDSTTCKCRLSGGNDGAWLHRMSAIAHSIQWVGSTNLRKGHWWRSEVNHVMFPPRPIHKTVQHDTIS